MAFTQTGFGDYLAGAPHSLHTRAKERFARKRQGIIYVPGLTGTVLSWRDGAEVKAAWLAAAQYRFRLFSINESIKWGNSVILAQLNSAYSYVTSTLGFRPRVHLFAASGGTPAVLNWAADFPSQVASIALVIPAVDIQDIHDNARTAAIGLPDAVYGPKVAYGGARPPDASNPADQTASLMGIPQKIWYSSSDPVCVPSVVTAYASAVGADTQNMGALGHNAAGMYPNDVVSFFQAHAKHP